MHDLTQNTRRLRGRILPWTGAVWSLLLAALWSWTAQAQVPEWKGPKLKAAYKIPIQAYAFDLKQVRLLDGPFKRAMDLDHQYLLDLDPDRLLHTFRINAGLPSTAQPLGGWEEPKGEVRGHSTGHFLTACALMYASTGDAKLKEKADYIVAELAKCQAAMGTGFLSAYPEEFIDRVEALRRVWAPYYTLHKIYAGLMDVYVHCDNPQALEVCQKFADWVIARNDKLTDDQMQAMLGNEHGGMNETLANLYALTGQEKYLKIAQRFNHLAVISPAANREDKLTGLHANTQIPKFVGTARQYELTGEEALKTASTFFWNTVVYERSYVIGGHSDGEAFSAKERLSEALGPNTTETCNTYNMLKLTRHLFCWEPKASIADYYERALYNHILASQNPETGMMCYYVPLRSGSQKRYNTPNDSFWCCTGTGMENHAKYGDSIYFHDGKQTLWLNLFIASELNWKEKGLKLRQETAFPDESTSRLVFTCAKPVQLSLQIRHPFWATAGVQIRVNGQPPLLSSKSGSYTIVDRTFHTGDTVDISLPFSLRTEGFADNPDRFAFLHGPLVLCAEINPQETYPAIVAEPGQILSGIRPVSGQASTFTAPGRLFRVAGGKQSGDLILEPFYKMHGDRHYMVYWDRFTPAQWQAKEKEYEVELARQKSLEARTVDVILVGHPQSERDHNLQGDQTAAGDYQNRKWRHAIDGGWFSYDLKVQPGQPQELSVTYWGSDGGNRVFDIQVDGNTLATQQLQGNRPNRFFEETYPMPTDLTQGKEKVTVKFQAHPGAWAGGVFGVRLLKRAADPGAAANALLNMGGYPIQAVPFTAVRVADSFWSRRLETNRVATIPHVFDQSEKTKRIDNFAVAGGLKEGKFEGIYFNDSDVYKIVEGASHSLGAHPDPELDKYLDDVIAKISAAQQPDGYLYTARTLCSEDYMPPGGKERWSDIPGGHELYCLGHLFEAGAAHYEATGKKSLLQVATKAADLVCQVFNEQGNRHPPGHEEIEIGLVQLYRVTGDEKYLRQGRFFLEQRGRPEGHNLYGTYSQDDKPVAEQEEAVGHAVRAAYLYAGMADVAAYSGDHAYLAALDRVWADVVGRKLYFTGGIGAAGGHEGFGPAYELPNLVAYCETCAAIANAFWNHRMFLLTGDARYMDVFERILYNGLISGVSLDGRGFFYPNPLESDGRHERSPWFGCACCPSNVPRFMPQIPGYAYAHRGDQLFVNLFLAGQAKARMSNQVVTVKQETRYPWNGQVRVTVTPEKPGQIFTLLLRVPGWARNEPVPSDLYRFTDEAKAPVVVRVNGQKVDDTLNHGYAVLRRAWQKGDAVEVDLPMPVRRAVSHPNIEDNVGKVALQRGPIVYCVESPDVKDGHVVNLLLPDDARITTAFEPDLLNGVQVLRGRAISLARTAQGQDLKREPVEFTAIPYYSWAHRGRGEMAVWLARTESAARPLPAPTIASTSPATKVPASEAPGLNLLSNASFEEADNNRPRGWRSERWGGEGSHTYAEVGRVGQRSVLLSSDAGADISWGTTAPVEPFARYRLSGWIKTDHVDPGTGRGALFNLHNIQPVATDAVTGTKDWTRVSVEFETEDQDAVQVNCLLGGWGLAKGSAWYDDLQLQMIGKKEMPAPRISIDAEKVGEPISKYVYGQFIEHLGRCIYGGIWAEMLEDRKFYYAVGADPSPWKPIGPAEAVRMIRENAFVGEHTPQVDLAGDGSGRGLAQGELALQEDKKYVGRVWLSGSDQAVPLKISLIWGDDPKERQTVTVKELSPVPAKTSLRFKAGGSTDNGRLEITAAGSGSFQVGTISLMPADNIQGMRADTLELLRQLDSPVYRWPGGNFVSGYDWKDGIGDPDRRPPRKNPAWRGVEPNDFGLDEFMVFCRLLKTDPYITVNTGLGDVAGAVEELQYANGPADTPLGAWRARNGHSKPYRVKFWAIGNEMYGGWQLGHMPLEQYIEKHNRFVDAMRAADPSIEVVAVGAVGAWSEGMMRHSAEHMDYISEHFYCQERPGLFGHVRQIPEAIRRIAEAHRRYRGELESLRNKDIRIALDEWNYWYGPHLFGELGTRYFLKDGLGIAAGLHEYARQSDLYYMANYAQTVNVIGCIKTSKKAAAFETTGLVLKLYRQHFGELPVATEVSGLLDAQAAWSKDRKHLTIGIVNPTLREVEIPLELQGATLKGSGTRWQMAGPDPMAFNDPDQPPKITLEESPVKGLRDRLTVAPCSVTLFALETR